MIKKPTLKNLIFFIFIAVEAVIYITFNVMAAAGAPDPVYLKYSGVLLCLAVSVINVFLYGRKADAVTLSCALLFTAVSDLFILVLDDYYEIGLVTFITVQSIYFYRLYAGRIKKIFISLAVRLCVSAAIIIVFAATDKLNLLVAECAVYITMLVANVADAFIICKKGKKNILFAVGLSLFLGCDVCVGLHNFGTVLNVALPMWLVAFASYAMWAFYLPSQVLITCSYDGGGLNLKDGCVGATEGRNLKEEEVGEQNESES